MIIDSFDNKSKPFLSADSLYKRVPHQDGICLVTFKYKVLNYVLEKYNGQLEFEYPTTGGTQKVYGFMYEGKHYYIYVTTVGATMSAIIMNEIEVTLGINSFVFFGSCGVLNEEKCRGKIIVPTESYRDEGISYHYAPANDYIDIKNSKKICKILDELHLPYVAGRIWTTDAIYMETLNKIAKRKEDGCLAVEMEISGVEAVARYHNINNYHILFSADSLDGLDWERGDFGGDKEFKQQVESFDVALKIAQSLQEK